MPGTVDSIQMTFNSIVGTPTAAVFLDVPIRSGMLHTVQARLEVGGLMTEGKVVMADASSFYVLVGPVPGEAILYDSGTVGWVASNEATSVADALVPPMPLTSNFTTFDVVGEPPKNKPFMAVIPSIATGAWTVSVRLTVSTS
jgi:hypothetical protein